MNVDTDIAITLSREEAKALRSALNIATRLAAQLPEGYSDRKFADEFDRLHADLRDAGVGTLPNTVQFAENILDAVRNGRLRELFTAVKPFGF